MNNAAAMEAVRQEEVAAKDKERFRELCDKLRTNDPTATYVDLGSYLDPGSCRKILDWEDTEKLAEALEYNTQVRTMVHTFLGEGRGLCADGFVLLTHFLQTSPSLQKLTLGTNNHVSSILEAIIRNQTITYLELNGLTYDIPKLLEKFLANTQTLTELHFGESSLGSPAETARALRKGIERNTSLVYFRWCSGIKDSSAIEEVLFGLSDHSKIKKVMLCFAYTRLAAQALKFFLRSNTVIESIEINLSLLVRNSIHAESELTPVLLGLASNKSLTSVTLGLPEEQITDTDACAAAMTEMFANNTTMTTFVLSNKEDDELVKLDRNCFSAIARGVRRDTTLQHLDVGSCVKPGAFGGVLVWREMLQRNSSLTTLDLSNCHIGDGAGGLGTFPSFAQGVSLNTTLKTLKLSSNSLGGAGVEVLANALQRNTVLEVLNLDCNAIGGHDGAAAVQSLWNCKSLKQLSVDSNPFGGGDSGETAFLQGPPMNQTFTTLDLSDCGIGAEDLHVILGSLHGNGVLEKLDLGSNGFSLEGSCATALRELLQSTPLQRLNLSYNTVTSQGMSVLAEGVRGNMHLRFLDLDHCELDNESLLQLGQTLVDGSALETLHVNNNTFDAEALLLFFELLPRIKSLKTLSFRSSLLNEDVGLKLVDALKLNTSLEQVHFRVGTVDISPKVQALIDFYLKMNRNGRKFLHVPKPDEAERVTLPTGVWPRVLAKMTHPSERDELFHFLRRKGDLVQSHNYRKRKAQDEPGA